jgi:3-oxoadipate enol-lactonase
MACGYVGIGGTRARKSASVNDMKHVEINDLIVCCELKGEGYPLVLIAGLSAHMGWWDPEFIDSLSEKFSLLTFDNRGAGQTVTPEEGEFSIEMFADDTAALMSSFDIERANILGLSMGGMIAQELALKYPKKVHKLALCSTHCGGELRIPPSEEVLQIMMDLSGGIEGRFERTLKLTFTEDFLENNPDFVERFKSRYLRAPCSDANGFRQLMAITKFSSCERLPQIKAPTLVAVGTADILIPPENGLIISERIPGAELVEYLGTGHGVVWQSRDAFITDLFEFLG